MVPCNLCQVVRLSIGQDNDICCACQYVCFILKTTSGRPFVLRAILTKFDMLLRSIGQLSDSKANSTIELFVKIGFAFMFAGLRTKKL